MLAPHSICFFFFSPYLHRKAKRSAKAVGAELVPVEEERMATAEVESTKRGRVEDEVWSPPVRVRGSGGGEGLKQYYMQHIHDNQLILRQKTHNLNRLEAQRNDLNSRGESSIPETLVLIVRTRSKPFRC